MNKQEMIKAIANETKLTQVDTTKVLNALESITHETIKKGEKVQLTGFINIKPVYRAARKGFDPIKKVAMDIAPTVGISVKAGEKLKTAVDGLDIAKFKIEEEASTEA
jgi:DNA-binding protein HU-beta